MHRRQVMEFFDWYPRSRWTTKRVCSYRRITVSEPSAAALGEVL